MDRRHGLAVIYTEGYINNQGGEEIAKAAIQAAGRRLQVSSSQPGRDQDRQFPIGISILIEIIEKMLEIDGKLAFCSLTPTIEKTFNIMGLAQYASIYAGRGATAVAQLQA